jgi:hypothetical protein
MNDGQANADCPRCGAPFRCGVADAGPCPCTTLALDAATRAEANRRWHGCLCLRCLAELAAPGRQTSLPAPPVGKE